MPVNGIGWSEEAVEWFHAMVHNRTLYARLYPQGCEVTVELFFERGKIGAMRCITKESMYIQVLICCVIVDWCGDLMGRYCVAYCDPPEQRCLCYRRGASLSLRLSQNGHAKYRNGTFVKRSKYR